MSDVINFSRPGTPELLLTNAAEVAGDMEFVLMVFVQKDGAVRTEWSKLSSNLVALGAIEYLKDAIKEASE